MNHLPVCGYTPEQLGFGGINSGIDSTQPFISGHPCICEQLNACEQRVLDAAREAVDAMHIGRDVRFSVDVRADAIAVIDALKEKP